jgi:hypothetical protein
MFQPTRKLLSNKFENAQAMLEFALVFPLVLVLTYGIIEFGRMIFIYASVTGAAREGARYGAAAGGDLSGTIPRYARCAEIRNAVRSKTFLVNIADSDILINYDHGPGTSEVAQSCEILNNNVYLISLGDRIKVRVKAHYSPVISFLGINGFDIISENARTILVNVGIYGTPAP